MEHTQASRQDRSQFAARQHSCKLRGGGGGLPGINRPTATPIYGADGGGISAAQIQIKLPRKAILFALTLAALTVYGALFTACPADNDTDEPPNPTTINIAAIPGVTAPATGAIPVT
ncbi:MAG: hypothetical protein LBG72_01890, partial [Spirochaetaceae bacterium]|nr:hypothetical protein [Spirochaetaceae bacterium]